MLIIVSGLPGTGKTTFAQALAERLAVHHLNSDILRDQMQKRGQYDSETKALIYREMLDRTRIWLERNETVVVDATFYKKEFRRPYLELSQTLGCTLHWIELSTDEAVIRQRVSRKRDYSEADFTVYEKIKKAYEPLDIPHLDLTSEDLDQMLKRAESYLKAGKL